ncbi:hypothetical protein [Endozoicomonas elysicola]|uniref:hypothetical protein n=1 Tax=Endozoicomonas elysicola TaxID=305900 RepID=UPI000525F704|nr:hypothetical protein [Endozoicomonas elysicola]
MVYITGKVVKGYGVASGQASDCPFPGGSIRLQKPCFLEKGLDLSDCFDGTLNISIAPYSFHFISPELTLPRLVWPGGCETFSFSRCFLQFGHQKTIGWIYYPHPETKPGHFHRSDIIEVLSPWLEGVGYGSELTLLVKGDEVLIEG